MITGKACEHCGGSVTMPARGRTPKYCTSRCRVAAHRARRLPAEMQELHRWVRFRNVQVSATRSTRKPIMVNGRSASSTNPRTWTSLEEARKSTVGEGLGFVLGDGIGGIDLDHCIVDGVLAPWAQEVVDRCPPTYIEVSPSGTGLHIYGLIPAGRGRGQHGRDGIEFYSTGRYFTVTENRWPGSVNSLGDLRDVVATL